MLISLNKSKIIFHIIARFQNCPVKVY